MSLPISGFTAIPNPQMLAFMPIQSYLMMYFAGSGWQFGKRKISAMSNEQFNKLTPEELLRQHSIELKNMLPTLTKTLNDVTPLIRILIEQYGDFIKEALKAIPQAVSTATGIPILTGQEKIDYDKAFFDWLRKQFPSLPEAEARRGSQQFSSGQDLIKSTTSRTPFKLPSERQTTEELMQAARLRQRGVPEIKPQLSISQQRSGRKRKAGQSQILERVKLSKQISDLGKRMRADKREHQQRFMKKSMDFLQQKLVNLLGRYDF